MRDARFGDGTSLPGLVFWAHRKKQFIEVNGDLVDNETRVYMAAAGYLLGCFTDIRFMGDFKRMLLASKVFGHEAVESAINDRQRYA